MTKELAGKTALITGGSRGIGRALALKLAGMGADIAILYVGDPAEAADTCGEVEKLGVKVAQYVCDVVDLAATEAAVKAVIKTFGSVDILINNAGITRDGLILTMTEGDYDAVLDINLKGAFNMIKSCYRNFIRRKQGKIINMASIAGIMGNAGQANYAASKAGLIGLTKSVARELAGKNINCNAVAPGFITTGMTEDIGEGNKLFDSIPMKRMGSVEDVANVVAFLAGSGSDYITGEVIRVDGGLAI